MSYLKQRRLSDIGLVLVGAVLLCYMAFYNNYPLVYPDTGTYVSSGFERVVPGDRPLLYGLFIRHASLKQSPWIVIFVQGLAVSTLLLSVVRALAAPRHIATVFLSVVSVLVFATGASVNVSQLIPDVFAPVFLMALLLLLFGPKLRKRHVVVYGMLLWFSLSVHNSHLLIAGSLLAVTALLAWRGAVVTSARRLATCAGIFAIAFVTSPTIHYLYDGGFSHSRDGQMFVMNRLVEVGMVDAYLADRCPTEDYALCAYRGQIPTDFLWDYDNSPVYKTGGWDANEAEYHEIITGILTTPKFLKQLLVKAASYTAKQFFSFETGDTPAMLANTPPHSVIETYFSHEIREYELARQQRANAPLDYDLKNQLTLALFLIGFVLALRLLRRGTPWERGVVTFVLTALLLNAMICANLSTVVPRYQSRVVWLLPLTAALLYYPTWAATLGRLFKRSASTSPSLP